MVHNLPRLQGNANHAPIKFISQYPLKLDLEVKVQYILADISASFLALFK